MAEAILAIFDNQGDAEAAVSELERRGYNPKEMSVIMQDTQAAREMSETTGTSVGEGAASGAVTGGIVGGIAGLLIGVGAITVPGIGALLIGGPLAAALGLTGAAATTASGALTGALAGGLLGALVNLGVPEDEARRYEERVKEGAVLLAVPSKMDGDTEVTEILESNRADQVRAISLP